MRRPMTRRQVLLLWVWIYAGASVRVVLTGKLLLKVPRLFGRDLLPDRRVWKFLLWLDRRERWFLLPPGMLLLQAHLGAAADRRSFQGRDSRRGVYRSHEGPG